MELREPVVSDVKGETQVRITRKGESTDAEHWDGVACSSDETTVMVVERRSYIRLFAMNVQLMKVRRKY